jgi:hypothetical protein
MAATYDSADLLLTFNEMSGRPASGDSITDARKYAKLSKSQNRVVAMLAAIYPNSLYPHAAYGSFPTCTTTDNQVFTFGTDANGYAVYPIGKTMIYPSLASIPDYPWRKNIDYLDEGTQIRIPNNRTWTSTLWWRGITNPPDMDATHQPSLFPEASRELIVIDAVRQLAQTGKRDPTLLQIMQGEWDRAWPRWCLMWRTAYSSGGALGSATGLRMALAANMAG